MRSAKSLTEMMRNLHLPCFQEGRWAGLSVEGLLPSAEMVKFFTTITVLAVSILL